MPIVADFSRSFFATAAGRLSFAVNEHPMQDSEPTTPALRNFFSEPLAATR